MLSRVVSAAYRAQQLSLLLPALAVQRTVRLISRTPVEFDPDTVRCAQSRYKELLATDLDNVATGMYPGSLLFQFPFADYLRSVPSIVRDFPRTMRRYQSRNFRDLPDGLDEQRYPAYYLRNFHWQTDGYFSRRSARLYDPGVEFLFLGTADIMRRQIIPPITRFLRGRVGEPARLLDFACGTGRTLRQISVAHPELSLCGLDLSPYYIQLARELLAGVANLSLVVDNAESMPFVDDYFDIVISVFLFHELPKDARRRALAEAYRVIRPGGLLCIQDSAQRSDSPEIARVLDRFAVDFHEPYYKSYLRDDLQDAITDVGFEVETVENHFVSKLVTARKPRL